MKKISIYISAILSVAISFSVFGISLAAAPESLPTQALEHMPVCPPTPGSGQDTRCHARVVTDKKGSPNVSASPTGLSPQQFKAAYNPAGAVGSPSKIIAIVDAYDSPTAFSDLQVYSSQFGLTQMSQCPVLSASSTPCFQKIDQNGGVNYPAVNGGWALEIALDVQAAHALCPDCSILLVEATTNSFTNLMAAVDRAAAYHPAAISNSYGASEFSGETAYDFHFNRPGMAITVSSGDNGFGTEYPAASQYVTAVGGTTLNMNGTSYLGENAWSGAGSGCSSYEPKPSFQSFISGCAKRMIADVSAAADPNTGASVYDTTPYNNTTGWFKVGGTSLAAPLVAAMYALGGVPTGVYTNTLPYSNVGALHDVTSGNNGRCRRLPSFYCSAGVGYDGPTGLGTPNGIGGF